MVIQAVVDEGDGKHPQNTFLQQGLDTSLTPVPFVLSAICFCFLPKRLCACVYILQIA